MRSFRKLLVLFGCLGLAIAGVTAKDKDAGKKDAMKKKQSEKKVEKTKPAAAAQNSKRLSLPIPEGHDSEGLKIPYLDAEGRLQMNFNIGVASRIDDDHIKMGNLHLEAFDEAGQTEMTIHLPSSILDVNTRVISTETGVTIWRKDFEISGRTMEFNTETRHGKLAGNVRMLIYNLENEIETKPEEKPRE